MISWDEILKNCTPVSIERYRTKEGKVIYAASLGKPSVRICGERWENLQKVISDYIKDQQ